VVNMLLQLCEAHASAATLASCARRLEFSWNVLYNLALMQVAASLWSLLFYSFLFSSSMCHFRCLYQYSNFPWCVPYRCHNCRKFSACIVLDYVLLSVHFVSAMLFVASVLVSALVGSQWKSQSCPSHWFKSSFLFLLSFFTQPTYWFILPREDIWFWTSLIQHHKFMIPMYYWCFA
jgi:hypothetical protein